VRIELSKVWKGYGEGASQFWALRDVSLTIADGPMIAVVGPSGSGKSTLLHLLGFLDTPTRGSILLDEAPVNGLSDRELSLVRRNRIGFVFQQYHLNESLTALQNVMVPLELARVRRRKELAAQVLSQVGLASKLGSYPAELSGGEQQRVAIARALVNAPELILADEPTGNLDSTTGAHVLELLRELNKEKRIAVALVTHDEAVARSCGTQIQVRDGRLL
jgi:putative ABC transport system ATP-binding protein